MNWKYEIKIRLDRLLMVLLVLALAVTISVTVYVKTIFGFLSISRPVPAKILIVEGWIPDFGIKIALETFRRDSYQLLLATGTPLSEHAYISSYRSEAEQAAASLIKLGLHPDSIAVAIMPETHNDRTYTTALYANKYLLSHGYKPQAINVLSVGPHCRRSWLMYRKAFGKDWQVGIINAVHPKFRGEINWHTTEGFKSILDETAGYLYVKFLFRKPPVEQDADPAKLN
jgi:hypothetical protein